MIERMTAEYCSHHAMSDDVINLMQKGVIK